MWRGLLVLGLVAGSCSVGDASTTVSSLAPTTATSPSVSRPAAVASANLAGDFDEQRVDMVESQLVARGIADESVLDAMRTVPRHLFVSDKYADRAYRDHPLPIGFGQGISQPYLVALMTEFLAVSPGDRVLEIGTGSGYQAAVLAEMGLDVYTVEIIPELAEEAAARLAALEYSNVTVWTADGYFGWDEHAPFDAIVVTAAPDHVPQPLVQQLTPGGRMVIPVGPAAAYQTLWRFTADASGEVAAENMGTVRFVPFTRDDGKP